MSNNKMCGSTLPFWRHMEFLNLPIIAAARSTPLKLQFPKPPATKTIIPFTHRSLWTEFQLPNYVANQAKPLSCASFRRVFRKVLLFSVLICFVWFCLALFFSQSEWVCVAAVLLFPKTDCSCSFARHICTHTLAHTHKNRTLILYFLLVV